MPLSVEELTRKIHHLETIKNRQDRDIMDMHQKLAAQWCWIASVKYLSALLSLLLVVVYFLWDWLLTKAQIHHKEGLIGYQLILLVVALGFFLIAFWQRIVTIGRKK